MEQEDLGFTPELYKTYDVEKVIISKKVKTGKPPKGKTVASFTRVKLAANSLVEMAIVDTPKGCIGWGPLVKMDDGNIRAVLSNGYEMFTCAISKRGLDKMSITIESKTPHKN